MEILFKRRMCVLFIFLFGTVFGTNALAGNDYYHYGEKKYYHYGKQDRNYLYTASNELGNNAVIGYKVNENGSLDELPGSPFPTGGSGVGAVLFTENGVVASEDGKLLYVANPGSNDISVFHIRRNGSLLSVTGSPFPTGGSVPVSLALNDKFLYVSHIGSSLQICDGCDIRGYRIGNYRNGIAYGAIKSIPNSIVSLPELPASFPLAIDFDPTEKFVVGTTFAFTPISTEANFILTMEVDQRTGNITHAPGSPRESQDTQPIGFEFSPTDSSQLFVSNVVSVRQEPGTVSSYLMGRSGQVAPIFSEPFSADEQEATCWIAFTSNGQYMYATNTFSDSIVSYQVDRSGALTYLNTVAIPDNFVDEEEQPLEIKVTDDDKFLYVVNGNTATVVGYLISSDGSITLQDESIQILSRASKPFGLAYISK